MKESSHMSPKESRSGNLIEYGENKFWFSRENNLITLGITAAGLDEITEASSISFPVLHEMFNKEDMICEVDGVDGALKLVTPASGTIVEVNSSLQDDIQILNEDPIDEGWLVKLEVTKNKIDSDLKEYS